MSGHIAPVEEIRNYGYNILIGKPKWKRQH